MMDKGVIISGAGHAGLILWVLIGGFFQRPDDALAVPMTEVSLLSGAEFEALLAASPTAPPPEPAQTDVAAPAPVAPDPTPEPIAPVVEAPPEQAPPPAPMPEPDAAPPALPDPEPAPPAP
ncbi:MAG: cell envelope biogenesis protein TolA, partial [Pseudorhodobacter sp.]